MDFEQRFFQALANGVLLLHAGVVLFVVAGLFLVLLGGARKWRWVRNVWFRVLHLAVIGYVALQSWFDAVCPLTTLELWLRARAGRPTYHGDFIAHWIGELLFYAVPSWIYVALYSAFALLMLWSWVIVRPGARSARADG